MDGPQSQMGRRRAGIDLAPKELVDHAELLGRVVGQKAEHDLEPLGDEIVLVAEPTIVVSSSLLSSDSQLQRSLEMLGLSLLPDGVPKTRQAFGM